MLALENERLWQGLTDGTASLEVLVNQYLKADS